MMTKLLEQAFAEVAKLPDPEQDTFAAWILEELASEQRWARAFDASQDLLAELADEAVAEHRTGRTQPLDINQL
jgi:hypothetical protein